MIQLALPATWNVFKKSYETRSLYFWVCNCRAAHILFESTGLTLYFFYLKYTISKCFLRLHSDSWHHCKAVMVRFCHPLCCVCVAYSAPKPWALALAVHYFCSGVRRTGDIISMQIFQCIVIALQWNIGVSGFLLVFVYSALFIAKFCLCMYFMFFQLYIS